MPVSITGSFHREFRKRSIERNIVSARRMRQKLWVLLDPEKEAELKSITENSTKIAIARSKSQKSAVGGVL